MNIILASKLAVTDSAENRATSNNGKFFGIFFWGMDMNIMIKPGPTLFSYLGIHLGGIK